ncbi:MAG TPA: histidine kinase [Chitinophagaceae bacterium]|nr:histidine kinase [Chitinophagaceae bacterium]
MRFTFVISFVCAVLLCSAQQPEYTAFTVREGLPSNNVYRCVEDDKGFLWIATDAGIARFDGRHFQVFTTREGLPDNEVLEVTKENDGHIWINCFKQSPSYFDEEKNRFSNLLIDSTLAGIMRSTTMTTLFPLRPGGVMYQNQYGSFILRNRQVAVQTTTPAADAFIVKQDADGLQVRYGTHLVDSVHRVFKSYIFTVRDNKNVDSVELSRNVANDFPIPVTNGEDFYNFYPQRLMFYKLSNIHAAPLHFTIDSATVPESFIFYGFTGNWMALYSYRGKIFVYDIQTLRLQFTLGGNYLPQAFYKDSHNNYWVSTIDKGLLLFKNESIQRKKLPAGFTNTFFLSVSHTPGGNVLAGNLNGQVVEFAGTKTIVHKVWHNDSLLNRQRKILFSHNKVLTFSENGIFADYKRRINDGSVFVFGKTATQLNDSIIIAALSSGLRKLNVITEQTKVIPNGHTRATALATAANNFFYWGSTDGLYRYDYNNQKFWHLGGSNLLSERVTGLCVSPDSIVWMASAGNGIVGLRHDTVAFHITTDEGLIGNDARCVTLGRPGQLWVGTSSGISIINYTPGSGRLQFNIQNISVNDGLTNNVVNEMMYYRDTIYAATTDGLSVIPAGISLPQFNIPVQLVSMSINQRDTIISSAYNLPYNQRNIQMQLAGIELGGHLKNLQYTVDKNSNWVTLDQNILALQLNSGNHIVQVRAVDVNGNISNKILTLQFFIATPFWKAVWFWVTTAIVLQLGMLYFLNRWLKKKREARLAGEVAIIQTAALEQQAFTSLLNPHFMFNALNSIQHYINLQDRKNANRYLSDFASLVRKSFEASQKSFISLEEELENIKIYLRLEQVRFSGRFSYEINIDENTDVDKWMIPAMMLQPFLENALLHGIMPSLQPGKIDIDIKEMGKTLLLTITDNGIGIVNSKALKDSTGHKSLGMELIQKRVDALNRFSHNAIHVHFSVPYPGTQNPGVRIAMVVEEGLYYAWLSAQKS